VLGVTDGVLTDLSDQRLPEPRPTPADLRILVTRRMGLPERHDLVALPLDDRRVVPQRLPDLDVLALDDSLRTGHLGAQHGMIDRLVALAGRNAAGDKRLEAVAHQQVVVEANE
jgi:hypothetical protein